MWKDHKKQQIIGNGIQQCKSIFAGDKKSTKMAWHNFGYFLKFDFAFQNEVKIVLIIKCKLIFPSDLLKSQKWMNKIAQNWASLQKIKCNKIVSYKKCHLDIFKWKSQRFRWSLKIDVEIQNFIIFWPTLVLC